MSTFRTRITAAFATAAFNVALWYFATPLIYIPQDIRVFIN